MGIGELDSAVQVGRDEDNFLLLNEQADVLDSLGEPPRGLYRIHTFWPDFPTPEELFFRE